MMTIRFRRTCRRPLAIAVPLLLTLAVSAAAEPPLALQPHDRVMLLGNTLAERQQLFNHFETSLLTRFPELELTVRNLGWSGDTPALQPRPLNFGDAATHLTAQRADVILAFFGLNESFAGEAGVATFERDLEAWIALHRAARYNGRSAPRIVLVSPIAHERLARLVHVDAEARNRELARYTESMRRLAARLEVPFVDVFTPMRAAMAASPEPLTINGIHLNETGDRVFAGVLMTALGFEPAPSDTSGTAVKAFETLREQVRAKNQLWFYRFRPLNAEYVVGRRVNPFGSVNFPGEMKRLDDRIAEQDQQILAPGPDHREGRGAMTRHTAAVALLALAMAGVASGVVSTQAPRKEPNLGGDIDLASQDPAVALTRLKPADGYEVSLFASEREFPELANPLAMTFDTRGRLWVLTSPTYPHVGPDETPNDKLIILEDGNGDGRADKVKVFADRLYIPTGFALGDGGVYISQQPNLMFLQDTNGDDRADVRRVILHGFGTEDSHHSIHAYTWGPDGALYFQEGTFLHSQVETPYGPVRVDYASVFRYEPRTEKLSVFVTYPFANPWGHVVDGWGQNFISDASNGYNYWGTAFSGHVDYPNKQKPMREWTLTRVRPTAGSEFVRSRQFPESAQGNFLFNNTIGFQGIKQYRTVEDGSGFVGVEVEPLLQSTDPNFRPVAMQFGPDGALYVVDWFNPLVGHMQYSLRDPRRDKTHGRVWRITAKGRPLLARPVIHGATIAQQLDLLKAYEDRTRYQARLALRDRPTAEVLPAVQHWIDGLDQKDALYEHHLLEALWVHEHHDTVNLPLLKQLLGAKEFRARAAAVRVLQHWFDRVDGAMALLAPMVRDEAPRVRLEAVRALSFVPTAAAAEAALGVLTKPMDYYLQYVLDSTMTTLEPVWKPRLTSGAPFAEDNPAGLAFVLERLEPGELASVKRSDPVYEAMVSRPGIDQALRRDALNVLATRTGVSMGTALLAAVNRVAATPGAGAATADLMRLLADMPTADLAAQRPALENLARTGALDTVRQGALLALLRLDGSADAVWRLTATSARLRTDLLSAAAAAPEGPAVDSLRAAVLPWLRDGVTTGAALAPPQPPLPGRYVRLVRPGRATVLSVAEVQVFSGGENIAMKGTATQSSTLAGGATGGHAPRAIDGGLEANLPAGTDPLKGTVQFTSAEQDPWWELDLGAERPIDTVALWAASAETRTGLYVSILDASRKPVFVQDGLRLQAPMHPIDVGGDLTIPLQAAAIALLPAMRGHEAETVPLLATLMTRPALRQAALVAIRRMPAAAWPPAQVPAVAREVLRNLSAIPAAQRIGPAVAETFAFGRELVARLPEGADRQAMTAQLEALLVRVIRIEAVAAQMKFDVSRFTVTAGETVVIELVNKDEMPHNLVVGKEGALETVGLAADKMVALPDAFAKSFVPATPEVLFSIRLLNPGETVQARFTAPTQPGNYPFICTFPAHWRTMNGIVDVRPAATQVSQP